MTQPIAIGWMSNDLHELGAAGDASKANAAKGEACAELGVEGFIELLRDVHAFDLARLGHGPLFPGDGYARLNRHCEARRAKAVRPENSPRRARRTTKSFVSLW